MVGGARGLSQSPISARPGRATLLLARPTAGVGPGMGSTSLVLPIPPAPALRGLSPSGQWIVADAGAEAGDLAASPAVELAIFEIRATAARGRPQGLRGQGLRADAEPAARRRVRRVVIALLMATMPTAFAAQRTPIAVDQLFQVEEILHGGVGERQEAARVLAGLGAGAAEAVRRLLAVRAQEPKKLGARGGRLCSTRWEDTMIGLPAAEAYVMEPCWHEWGAVSGVPCLGSVNDIDARTDARAVGCWLVQGWGKGNALVPELRALLAGSVDDAVRGQAAWALGARGDAAAVGDLVVLLSDARVGGRAAEALVDLGAVADSSVLAAWHEQRIRRTGEYLARDSASAGTDHVRDRCLWYFAQTAARVPVSVLSELAEDLAAPHAREALTVLVRAGPRAEAALVVAAARRGAGTTGALAGLVLLPGRGGPAFPIALAWARDGNAPARLRTLALRYVAESTAGASLLPELVALARSADDCVVRTAATRALGRMPGAPAPALEAAHALLAGADEANVRIAALRAVVQLAPNAATRQAIERVQNDRGEPRRLRNEAAYLLGTTDWQSQ